MVDLLWTHTLFNFNWVAPAAEPEQLLLFSPALRWSSGWWRWWLCIHRIIGCNRAIQSRTPGTITGSATTCAELLSIIQLQQPEQQVIHGHYPAGWSGTSTTTSITVAGANGGNISVTAEWSRKQYRSEHWKQYHQRCRNCNCFWCYL